MKPTHLPFARHSRRRTWLGLVSGLALAAGIALVPSAALADTGSIATTLHGSTDLGSRSVDATAGFLTGSIGVSASLSWDQGASVNPTWNANLVRQGRHLDPTVGYARTSPGTLSIDYEAHGSLGIDTGDLAGVLSADFDPQHLVATGTCDLRASGAAYTCHVESGGVKVVDPTPLGYLLPYVELNMVGDVTITPQALATLRTASAGDQQLGTNDLDLQDTAITDPLLVGCRAGVGDDLGYALGDLSTTPGIHVVSSVGVDAGLVVPITPPFPGIYTSVFSDSVPVATTDTDVTMSGSGGSVDMGAIKANNIPPTLGAVSAPDGIEGSPIQFSTSATGPCADGATYSWDFGDGSGRGHTATPQHTYADNGVYTGQVVVTDVTGLTDTQDFTVHVSNANPNVSVVPGAPVTVAWGRPLTLQAQAVDPGSADQSTLTYAWSFGDGDSIASGGASVTHQWATPGTVNPTVTVCDKDGGCTTRTFAVTVRARTTSLSYTGPQAGTYSGPSGLSASLVDEFGNPVNGGAVSFAVDGTTVGSSTTGAGGNAGLTYVVTQTAGAHTVSTSYAGSSLYTSTSTGSQPFAVSAMASTLTYTGGLSGGPNKAVAVSAKVVDALGRPLAGVPVTFVIGSQSTTATTNASGVAAGSIKLTQKPAWYPLTASWPGVAGKYLGDSAAAQFSLNKK